METSSVWLWIGFNLFVLGMLALDLGVFHRKAHVVSFKEASVWSAVWIALALLFNAGIWHFFGPQKGVEFLTGYLIEKSLRVDNIFVFVLIFATSRCPQQYQHRVLFWGILGALVMRAIFIAAGAALIASFHWIIYVFGAFLIFTGHQDGLRPRTRSSSRSKNPVVRLVRRLLPGHRPTTTAQSFFVREKGVLRHAALRGAGAGGDHRPHLRRRLDPGHLRGHHGTRSSSTPRTSSPSSACARSTSSWPG